MNKLAEKISSIMTDEELLRLIDDHYQGESQLLTNGTEANLLKLAEIRGCMSEEQSQRWTQIKSDFMRNKAMGGDDADTGAKIVVQLNDLVGGINEWRDSLEKSQLENNKAKSRESNANRDQNNQALTEIAKAIDQLVENINTSAPGETAKVSDQTSSNRLADVLENTLQPLVRIMNGKLDLDLGTHKNMSEINRKLDAISKQPKLKEQRKQTASKKPSKKNPGNE